MILKKSKLLPKTWNIPDVFHSRLGDRAGRQRLMDEEDHLLLILHEAPKASDDARRNAVFFWRNPAGEWKSAPHSGGMAALTELLANYKKIILALDEKVEAAEAPREYFSILKETTPLQRAARHALETLQKSRDARKKDAAMIRRRDEAVDIERAIDLVHSDAMNGMEFVTAEQSAEQADLTLKATHESRKLNRLVAFFFPLVTIIGLLGMNDPMEAIRSGSFWAVIGIGIALGALVRSVMVD